MDCVYENAVIPEWLMPLLSLLKVKLKVLSVLFHMFHWLGAECLKMLSLFRYLTPH